MSLEVYTGLIKDLVITNPTPTDPKSQGDDHLRGIKKTMVEDCMRVSTAGFCKNKLFNGEVTRINQRNFDGNWVAKNWWSAGMTVAQAELCYGYDMWAKVNDTLMGQPIEAGNFRPSTVHTLSGIGVTTQQITSPASGNWTITVPQTARNVQVEEGTVATPFEIRPYGFELEQCQRYFCLFNTAAGGSYSIGGALAEQRSPYYFSVKMRTDPVVSLGVLVGQLNTSTDSLTSVTPSPIGGVYLVGQGSGEGTFYSIRYDNKASAVI